MMTTIPSGLSRGFRIAAILAAAACGQIIETAKAADDFCGQPAGEPQELLDRVVKEGAKQVHDARDYVAYQDDRSGTVFTFTRASQGPAHPAAVCRMPVREGDVITLRMVVVCRGAAEACRGLESDFRLLNARMEAHIRGQAAATAGPPK